MNPKKTPAPRERGIGSADAKLGDLAQIGGARLMAGGFDLIEIVRSDAVDRAFDPAPQIRCG